MAAALTHECGAVVVSELDGSGAPRVGSSAVWFVERHAEQWRLAQEMASGAPFAILDGDPFKGLWYNRVYSDEGWEGVETVAPLYRSQVESGGLAFPNLYVVLTATEDELRRHRAGDPSRSRRNFEKHLLLTGPLLDYFRAMREVAPARVTVVETGPEGNLVNRVTEAVISRQARPTRCGSSTTWPTGSAFIPLWAVINLTSPFGPQNYLYSDIRRVYKGQV